MLRLFQRLQGSVARLKREITALYLAYKDPRVPWTAKVFSAVVVGYALSPLDLIPDFIPVLGYLDDLILLPLGIWLALKMIPPEVLAECRQKARQGGPGPKLPVSFPVIGLIIVFWLFLAVVSVVCILALMRAL